MTHLEVFLKRAGWKKKPDGWSTKTRRYRLVHEAAPGSWDRAVSPFLAKAILEARAGAGAGEPLAVLSVKRATPLTDERLTRFVREVAPNQSWILVDADGRVFPHVASAPELSLLAREQPALPAPLKAPARQPSLFTDLNQWLLKVLLAQQLSEKLITAPRGRLLRNASVLAEAANVSVAVAARFVRALDASSQLDTRFGDLRIARPLELLQQWRDRGGPSARHEVAAISVRGPLNLSLTASIASEGARVRGERPPLVFGLHTACTELGYGHVTGAVPVIWTPSLDLSRLESFGLVAHTEGQRTDVVLRVPRFPEALYRGVVQPNAAPVTDIIQCWLDTSHHRVRGEEQADYLWRRVLRPAFDP